MIGVSLPTVFGAIYKKFRKKKGSLLTELNDFSSTEMSRTRGVSGVT